MDADGEKVRIDKWLWAARFFKTRSLATEAVDGGKVEVNGARAKPAKLVGAGDEVSVRVGTQLYVVRVKDTAERRGSAERAQELYDETPESAAARAKASEQQRLAAQSFDFEEGRPSKRDRRELRKFRGR
jgi:ribosome-associated heat shock protein Hsp15